MIPTILAAITSADFYPTVDASTLAGQFQWFMAGFCYAALLFSVLFMVKIFKKAAPLGE